MSTFGYRRELSKYEDVDEDELLASLTDEELKELERELGDIDPDRTLPVGQRQKSLTQKTPTGTFSREALMAYWERETRKLLEKERMGTCEQVGWNIRWQSGPRDIASQALNHELLVLSSKADLINTTLAWLLKCEGYLGRLRKMLSLGGRVGVHAQTVEMIAVIHVSRGPHSCRK